MQISRLGLGCAPLGGLFSAVDDVTADKTLEEAWSGGVRYFDTAPHYGSGLSEVRLGRFLRHQPRDQFVVSTKVGRLLVSGGTSGTGPVEDGEFFGGVPAHRVFDYSAEGIHAALESSLQRLGLDRVDIVFIHDPDDHMVEALDEAYPALARLRDQGVVGAIGVGMNRADLLTRFVRETDIDVVLVAGRYSLLDDRAAAALLPACAAGPVAVLVGGVFNSGVLADPAPGATFDYGPAAPALIERARRIAEIAATHGVSLPTLALQWPLRHLAVTGIIVGARSPEEVSEDLRSTRIEVPQALWDELDNSGLLGWSAGGTR